MTHTRDARSLLLLLAVLAVAGCNAEPQVSVRDLSGGITVEWCPHMGHMPVLYATDRSVTWSEQGHPVYGAARGEPARGVCDVTIPASHRISEYAQVAGDEASQYTLVGAVNALDDAQFSARLTAALDAPLQDGRVRAVLIFVHGFYNAFDDGVRRTAQLAYDLGIDVVPICYTWPSAIGFARYAEGSNNVDWSLPHFVSFMQQVRAAAGTRPIHVIAHSMGAGIVCRALRRLSFAGGPNAPPMIDHLIMSAPDIDRDVFVTDLMEHVRRLCRHVTVYAASQDIAMELSRVVHGYPRLGDSALGRDGKANLAGIDLIDATLVNTTLAGHLYYGDSRPVIVDMFLMLRHNLPPGERFLMSRGEGEQRIWVLRP